MPVSAFILYSSILSTRLSQAMFSQCLTEVRIYPAYHYKMHSWPNQ